MVRSKPIRRHRRRPTRTTGILRSVHNSDIGTSFSPSIDPPPWAYSPWWPITITSYSKQFTKFSWNLIHKTTLQIIGLDKFTYKKHHITFNMRIMSVRIWSTDRKPITLDIFANSGSSCHKIRQLNDFGSANRPPSLGWRFGASSFAMLDSGCSTSKQVLFAVGGPSTRVICYIQLLVQLAGVSKATKNIDGTFDSLQDEATCFSSSDLWLW